MNRDHAHLNGIAEKMRELLKPLHESDRGYVVWRAGFCHACGEDLMASGTRIVCHCENDE